MHISRPCKCEENIRLALLSVPSRGISKADGISGDLNDVPCSEQRLYTEWGAGTRTMEYARARKQRYVRDWEGGGIDKKVQNIIKRKKQEEVNLFVGMFMVVVIYQHPSAPSCLSVCLSIHPP
jgi:hypothetical protein